MDDSKFAEIEIKSTQNRSTSAEAALRFFSSVSPPPQAIKPRTPDPIREKFFEMRRLASQRPFSRNDSELFYKQAQFMEEFTDNFEGNAKFNMYYPYYQNMGYEYLRTYFTWRTKIRNGEVLPTSLSYIFLYIYELLSGIGVSDAADGLNKLLVLWDAFASGNPNLEKYLAIWLKDYHIFYDLPHSFSDFIEERKMQKYYSLTLLFYENVENKLELWNNVSTYNVMNSKFYKDGNEQLMSDCFTDVLSEIQSFCIKRNTRFEDLIVYSVSRRSPWQPFKQALFQNQTQQGDREIIVSDFEQYFCKNGQWTARLPIYYSSQKDFVGYIIKKTEACLRQAVGYKYKLIADMKSGSKPFRELQRPAAKRAELDKLIENAVTEFHRNLTRTVVTVDHGNLARIREEAFETQEQLIVPEADNVQKEQQADEPAHLTACQNAHIQTDDYLSTDHAELTMSFSDGWKALRKALSDVEQKALSIALQVSRGNSSESTKVYADENNIMLEVLADSINEKAADYIGDNILQVDDELILYDEYIGYLENIVAKS
ncbi:MAG: TerB N-terminal domain-containing protein [Oscillospiraceae bacterium]|nr:TerB N-terminal domain-containing protein [Oscillospiraceae bacterium]